MCVCVCVCVCVSEGLYRVIENKENRRVSKCEKVFKKVIILWTAVVYPYHFLTCSKYARNEEYEKEEHFTLSSFQSNV